MSRFIDHLQAALPADQFEAAANLPEDTLKKLYENVRDFGPNGDNVLAAADKLFAVQDTYLTYSAFSRDSIEIMREDFEPEIDGCLTPAYSINHQSIILLKAMVDKQVGIFSPFGMTAWTLLYFLMVIHSVDKGVLPDFLSQAEELMSSLGLELCDYLPASMSEFAGSPS